MNNEGEVLPGQEDVLFRITPRRQDAFSDAQKESLKHVSLPSSKRGLLVAYRANSDEP